METVTQEHQSQTEERDPYYEELNRLFNLYRLANLNTRYYGCRAETFERYSKIATIAVAVFSATALALLLGVEGRWWVKPVAASLFRLGGCDYRSNAIHGMARQNSRLAEPAFRVQPTFRANRVCDDRDQEIWNIIARAHWFIQNGPRGFYARGGDGRAENRMQDLIDREDAKVRKAFPNADYVSGHIFKR